MIWAVKEFTKRRKCREYSFCFTFPKEGKGYVQRCASAPALRGGGFEVLPGNGAVAEQDVSAGLQLVSMLSSGAGSGGHCGLVCPVL